VLGTDSPIQDKGSFVTHRCWLALAPLHRELKMIVCWHCCSVGPAIAEGGVWSQGAGRCCCCWVQ